MTNETTASQPMQELVRDLYNFEGGRHFALRLEKLLPSQPKAESIEDDVMRQRDYYQEQADDLAGAIASYLGTDIGEHSSGNCPWANAINALDEADPYDRAPAAQASATIQAAPVGQYANEMFTILCRIHTVDKTAGYRTDLTDSVEELLTRIVATPAATIQEPVMVAEPVGESQWIDRLTYDAEVDEWGIERRNLESEIERLKSASPMVADPAVDLVKRLQQQVNDLCALVEKYQAAATVKAVPSEALNLLREVDEHAGRTYSTLEYNEFAARVANFLAAPLADNTGGGES